MTPVEWGLATIVMVVAAAVQGAVGFGMNLIAAPLLLLIDDRLVPGPAITAAIVMTGLTAVRDRRGLALGEVRWAFLGRIPGTALAIPVLALASGSTLSIILAGLMLAAVALTAAGLHVEPDRGSLLTAGAASGFMGTITSIGGPPLAVLYSSGPGVRLRGTLAGYFFLGTFVSIAGLVIAGRFGGTELAMGLGLTPGAVLGFAVSGGLAGRLDAGHTRKAVLVVSALAALSVVVSELV